MTQYHESLFQFQPLLESTLQADKQLEKGAKKLEKEKLERKRQEELAKHAQVKIKPEQYIILTQKHQKSLNTESLQWKLS